MIYKLTNELFQSYPNQDIRVDILYNNTFDFFYFETYNNDVLIKGDTRIVNNYENDYIKFSSLLADSGIYNDITSFSLEFKNAIN